MNERKIGDVAAALLEFCESNTTFQSKAILSVPAKTYTDPSQWHAEIDLIFKRVPLMLALSCELPRTGDYKAMEAAGSHVLIVRGTDETVRAFLNVCAHRWAPVVADGRGNCSRFTCPFHGWTYGVDGKLIGIPDRAKFGDIDGSAHRLRELPCKERHGLVFVCLTPGMAFDLDAYYGTLLDELAPPGLRNWAFLGSSILEGANWKIVVANFLESYHFAALHSRTVAQQYVPNVSHYEGFGPNMRIGFALRTIAQLREVPRAEWPSLETRHFTCMRYLFPNVAGSLLPGEFCAFTQIFPGTTPDRSRIVILYARRQPVQNQRDDEQVATYMKEGDRVLRDEDFAIGLEVQKRLESTAHEGMLYGRNEPGNQYFHEWMNWYLRADANSPTPVIGS